MTSAAAVPGPAAARCYGLRRVNPFLGVVMVVETDAARAHSVDGRHWQLQVAAHPPRGLWSGAGHLSERKWFRFGLWSAESGLTRVPLNPILDIGAMVSAADALVGAVAGAAAMLPFALAPELELWQLGRDGRPLALLAVAPEHDAPREAPGDATTDGPEIPTWSAGGRGERAFRSATLAAEGVPQTSAGNPARHVQELERRIAAAAGASRWVRRDAAGSGVPIRGPLSGQPADPAVGRLAAAAFPQLPLCERWGDALLDALVAEYVAWLAPYLLTLPMLDDARRRALEREAARDAVLVDRLWRLYPRVLDPELVRRARVEARLRATRVA